MCVFIHSNTRRTTMDQIDYSILNILKHNARETASNISKEVHLSVSSVMNRIRQMEDSGIIKGYEVKVDSKKLGFDVTAFMEVSLEHPKYYDSFCSAIVNHPNIADCYYFTGNFDFLLHITCTSSDELESVHREIKCIEGVSGTHTHFVLKTVKAGQYPLKSKNAM